MAQDIFSSNIQQNAPGLVYATPKSIEASDNSLGGIAKALNTIIPAAVNLDESRVMSEASDLANTMANEYKLGSETHINNLAQEKQRLEQDLATSGESTEITSRLNDIEAQLTLAQEQGRIGPGEFRARMMKAGQDLTNRNPAYQLEIANKMNAVFGATGVTSILAQDSTLLQTKANALIARKALKIETIETYEDTTGKSDEYINEKYKYYKDLEGTSARIKQVVDTMKNASDIQKRQVYNTFMDEGGYPQFANGIYADDI
jgi:predicted nuclease with TOPRIM domain